jgi:hypothetical protein
MPHKGRRVKVREKEQSCRLPEVYSEGALVIEHLFSQGVLESVGRVLQVYRQGGYVGLDVFLFFLLYFTGSTALGLSEFDRRIGGHRARLAALGGRDTLPTHASVSRFLKAVCETDMEEVTPYLLTEACGARELLRERCVRAQDGVGASWHIFDLDPTSKVLRSRALPDRDGLPLARRRASEARPGYLGRKRGELKVCRTTLMHSGSGLWLGIWTAPGQGDWRSHSKKAIERVVAVCRDAQLPLERVLLRVDGEGGNTPFITACQERGVHYLTRSTYYTLLDDAVLRQYLNEASWFEVEDSGSGPVRYAAELGQLELPCSNTTVREDGTPYAKVTSRMVIARYRTEEGRGVGRLIDGWQYELYATDVDAEAYAAPEVVALYHGRSGLENRFCQEDREMGLDRLYSYHLPGYSLACVFGLFVWNLRVCWGVRLGGAAPEAPYQEKQRLMAAQEPVLLPALEVCPVEVGQGAGEEVGEAPELSAEIAPDSGAPDGGTALALSPLKEDSEEDRGLAWPNEQANLSEAAEAEADDLESGEQEVPPVPTPSAALALEAAVEEVGANGPEAKVEPALPADEARRLLIEALSRQDWARLRQYQAGWRFSIDAGGILCENENLLTLRGMRLLPGGRTGILRFLARRGTCNGCPVRTTCMREGSKSDKAVILSVPAREALHVENLLTRACHQESPEDAPTEASAGGTDVVDDPHQALMEALSEQDWTRLRQYQAGWRFSRKRKGIVCANDEVLTLTDVKMLSGGRTGMLRFRARWRGCLECPLKSSCMRQNAASDKQVSLCVPAATARRIALLLAKARAREEPEILAPESTDAAEMPAPIDSNPTPQDTSMRPARRSWSLTSGLRRKAAEKPEYVAPHQRWERPRPLGEKVFLKPRPASLLPAAARKLFRDACREIEVHVTLTGTAPTAQASPLYTSDNGRRQHRRLSWTRRRQRNALSAEICVELDIQTPPGAMNLLHVAPYVRNPCP